MDDILVSADDAKNAKEITDSINVILEKGGFKVKNWTILGNQMGEQKMNQGKILKRLNYYQRNHMMTKLSVEVESNG